MAIWEEKRSSRILKAYYPVLQASIVWAYAGRAPQPVFL